MLLLAVVIALVGGLGGARQSQLADQKEHVAAPLAAARPANACAGNTEAKLALVSIGQRRLWLCEGPNQVYQAPVITGMEAQSSTRTPVGTYKIYGMMTNTTLTGSDEAGSWRRGVYYWLPFLDNEHGTYGFHDATWRSERDFGTINPASNKGSHGCVELTKGAMQRLYEWAGIGTAVSVRA